MKTMRNSFWILLLLAGLLAGCKPTVPSAFIQPDDMADILYDYHLAQAFARNSPGAANVDYNRSAYFYGVLRKYDITEAEFDSSLVYYYSHVDYLKDIYTKVNERLGDEAKALGASVGDIGKYSAYSATGDTANIWREQTALMLMPKPAANRFDFSVKVDTTFHLGDTFMLQFMTEFIYQSGTKDGVVCLWAKYEGDSIITMANHIAMSGLTQVRLPGNRENKLKELRGYIYLGNGSDLKEDVLKMMFISQLQLIRFHQRIESASLLQREDSVVGREADPAVADSVRSQAIRRRIGPQGMPVPISINRKD